MYHNLTMEVLELNSFELSETVRYFFCDHDASRPNLYFRNRIWFCESSEEQYLTQ